MQQTAAAQAAQIFHCIFRAVQLHHLGGLYFVHFYEVTFGFLKRSQVPFPCSLAS